MTTPLIALIALLASAALSSQAAPNRLLEKLPATNVRGEILASDGSPLARSVDAWKLHVDPKAVRYGGATTSNAVVEAVAQGLGLPTNVVRTAYAAPKSRYVSLCPRLTDDQVAWCQQGRNRVRYGLILERETARDYPLGAAAAHVTGRCGADAQLRGQGGLEYSCGKTLQGRANPLSGEAAVRGGAVRTTIDAATQKAVAEILYEAAASNHAESAWALVVKIPSGEIAAMASYPTFDPNARGLRASAQHHLANGAVQTLHEPGGLMKPLVAALAFESGVLKPDAPLDFGNAAFTNLCATLGTNILWTGLTRYRLGEKLGEGKLQGEQAGVLPRVEKWDSHTQRYIGNGRGIMMTGVQIAQAYATLANGGVRVCPYLVESETAGDGTSLARHAQPAAERQTTAEAAAAVTRLLVGQTNETAQVSVLHAICKTSTLALAERGRYSTEHFDALCAGWLPVDAPRYALVVAFRKPHPVHDAEQIARPVFNRMAKQLR